MKVTIVEGTPEEISKAFPGLVSSIVAPNEPPNGSGSQSAPPSNHVALADDDYDDPPVTTEMARKVLKRIPLSKTQRLVLTTLYHAYPSRVPAGELVQKLGYKRAQFTGLMGAFGRRIGHTDGYIAGTWFFDQEWDQQAGSNTYALPETVREAMRIEKLV